MAGSLKPKSAIGTRDNDGAAGIRGAGHGKGPQLAAKEVQAEGESGEESQVSTGVCCGGHLGATHRLIIVACRRDATAPMLDRIRTKSG